MFLRITEPNGRDVYINPHHIISVFENGNGGVNVKVSDGKVYLDIGSTLEAIVAALEESCFSQA